MSEGRELLANLRECVQHHVTESVTDLGEQRDGAAVGSSTDGAAAAVGAGQQPAGANAGSSKGGAGAKKDGAKEVQRLVLGALDGLEAKVKVTLG